MYMLFVRRFFKLLKSQLILILMLVVVYIDEIKIPGANICDNFMLYVHYLEVMVT